MLAKDLKPGGIVKHGDAPVIVETITVQSPSARGGTTLYKFRARNVVTKNKVDFAMKGTDMLPEADFSRRDVTIMYSDTESVHLLDSESYEQYSVAREDVADEMQWITEATTGIIAMIYNDECVGITIPASAALKITQCDPGVRGNSATGRTKPVTLETGVTIQAPEYIAEGEVIKVDTRTGEFLGRA
jgi:elongation factor P